MNSRIEKRCKEVAKYVIHKNATVRQAAKNFGISKSTVYNDLTCRLPISDAKLAKEVRKVLDKNKQERHIRGGMATKRKYQMQEIMLSKKG